MFPVKTSDASRNTSEAVKPRVSITKTFLTLSLSRLIKGVINAPSKGTATINAGECCKSRAMRSATFILPAPLFF